MLLKHENNNLGIISAFILLVVSLCIYLRFTTGYAISDYLWAEDGNIFLAQAYSMGMSSIWEPYSGYLHLYPRLIALLAKVTGLHAAPYVMFIGWILGFLCMAAVIVNRTKILHLSIWTALIVVVLIGLQPHSGEAFFNITNVQWFLGVGLVVYLLIDGSTQPRVIEILFLILLCLTGPFCVLLLPVLVLKALLFKDVKKNSMIYGVVLVCALIQLSFLQTRNINPEFDSNIYNWLMAFQRFFCFGEKEGCIPFIAFIFWLSAFYVWICAFFSKDPQLKHNSGISLLLTVAAMIIFSVALYSVKNNPLLLSPLGAGQRYYFTPYALFFFSIAIIGCHFKWMRIILLMMISIICYLQFESVGRVKLHFHAFSEFAQYKNELYIPINPQAGHYPSWGVSTNHKNKEVMPQVIKNFGTFDCAKSRYVGVEINLWKEVSGWVKIFWSPEDGVWEEKNSLQRFYPEGDIKAQFAFENNINNPLFFRVDTIQDSKARIGDIQLYCLHEK